MLVRFDHVANFENVNQSIIVIGRSLVASNWRKHLIICLLLGLLAIPIYFFDHAYFAPRGRSDWIALDFRGLIFWTYITSLVIHVTLSTIGIRSFPRSGASRIHLGSMVLSLALFITGGITYEKLRRWEMARSQRAFMEGRKPLMNVIELKDWWYVPDDIHPTRIDVSVLVHQSGRFAGNVTGEQTDPSGSSVTVFESTNDPESQRQVASGEAFTYLFPLKVLHATAHADDVRITLYLFKARSGPAAGDITKVFVSSPQQDDDGQYFYGVLPPPSRAVK